jgi:hypothetical protein
VARRRRFTGIIHFPSALPIDLAALGLAEAVKIGVHKVTLTLPQRMSRVPLNFGGGPR